MTLSRSRVERARRSRRVTTSTSPGSSRRNTLASSTRSPRAPLAFSRKTLAHPAAVSSASFRRAHIRREVNGHDAALRPSHPASGPAPIRCRPGPTGCTRSSTTAIAFRSAATATLCGCSRRAAMTGASGIRRSRFRGRRLPIEALDLAPNFLEDFVPDSLFEAVSECAVRMKVFCQPAL
jgi:hypothetical protein